MTAAYGRATEMNDERAKDADAGLPGPLLLGFVYAAWWGRGQAEIRAPWSTG